MHFHSLVLDGVYSVQAGAAPWFHPLPPASDRELRLIAGRIARRIGAVLIRRGLTDEADPDQADPLNHDQPLLALLSGAAIRGRAATGDRAGRRPVRLGDRIDADDVDGARTPALCCLVDGISLHAGVAVPARDRTRLERLCRYVARPPVASERLSLLSEGRLLYRLKNRWRDGTTHLVLESDELIERLAVLIPPPRANLVRYHGILAPRAAHRAEVVPLSPAELPVEETTAAEAGLDQISLGVCVDEIGEELRAEEQVAADVVGGENDRQGGNQVETSPQPAAGARRARSPEVVV